MNHSKLIGFIVSLTLLIGACNSGKQRIIEGDLYFYGIDLYRIFDLPDSTLTKFEHQMLQVNCDTCNRKDKDFIDLVKYAIKNKLTRQPYVWILINGKEYRLFLDQRDYAKLKNFEWSYLTQEHKKIYIKAMVYNVSFKELKAVKCVKLLDFKKIDGETKYK